VKLWTPSGTIVYSDERTLIGRRLLVSHGLEQGLSGRVEAEISEPAHKAESQSEREHGTQL
jgi:hypothetical protein